MEDIRMMYGMPFPVEPRKEITITPCVEISTLGLRRVTLRKSGNELTAEVPCPLTEVDMEWLRGLWDLMP